MFVFLREVEDERAESQFVRDDDHVFGSSVLNSNEPIIVSSHYKQNEDGFFSCFCFFSFKIIMRTP